MLKIASSAIVALSFLVLTSCEDSEKSDMFKAQQCIDNATAATAMDCISSIEGKGTKQALVLRCSARFISRGIDANKLVDAIEVISEEGQQANATSTAISNLAIPDDPANPTTYDVDFASEMASICAQTESDGLTALSSFALIATSTNSLLTAVVPGGCTVPYTEACVTDGLDNINPATTDATTIGETAIQNQETLCGEDGMFNGEDVCNDINAAIAGGGTADEIGDAILAGIANDQ